MNLLDLINLRKKTDIEITYEFLVDLMHENEKWILGELNKRIIDFSLKLSPSEYRTTKLFNGINTLEETIGLSLKLSPSRYRITKLFEEINKSLEEGTYKGSEKTKEYSSKIKKGFFKYKHDKNDFCNPKMIDNELQKDLSFLWNWELYEILLTLDALNIFELGDVPSEGKDFLGKKTNIRLIKMSHSIVPYRNRMAILPYAERIKKFETGADPYYYPGYVYESINKFIRKNTRKKIKS